MSRDAFNLLFPFWHMVRCCCACKVGCNFPSSVQQEWDGSTVHLIQKAGKHGVYSQNWTRKPCFPVMTSSFGYHIRKHSHHSQDGMIQGCGNSTMPRSTTGCRKGPRKATGSYRNHTERSASCLFICFNLCFMLLVSTKN